MKTHLFLPTAVGLAITVTTSHAALDRSLDETIQQYGQPTTSSPKNTVEIIKELAPMVQFDGIEYTISMRGIVDICFDGRAQVIWDV